MYVLVVIGCTEDVDPAIPAGDEATPVSDEEEDTLKFVPIQGKSSMYKDLKSFYKLDLFLDSTLTIAELHRELRFVYDMQLRTQAPSCICISYDHHQREEKTQIHDGRSS